MKCSSSNSACPAPRRGMAHRVNHHALHIISHVLQAGALTIRADVCKLSREARWCRGRGAAHSHGSCKYPSLGRHSSLCCERACLAQAPRHQHTSRASFQYNATGHCSFTLCRKRALQLQPLPELRQAQHGKGTCVALAACKPATCLSDCFH